ncbi:MAG TPA: hypothetical protein VEV44_06100 [Pseudoneobacillus sp.]|nr:hypothetical protein [Pseudoneobacillus sp.]
MEKRDPKEHNSFYYDEDGINQVSEQIMNSYNSGVIGEQEQTDSQTEGSTEL